MSTSQSFDAIERAVLCELIANPRRSLPLADDLDCDCFRLFPHQRAFVALRNLQARGEAIGLYEVFEQIESEIGAATGGRRDDLDRSATLDSVAAIVVEAKPYGDAMAEQFSKDVRSLLVLAEQWREMARADARACRRKST